MHNNFIKQSEELRNEYLLKTEALFAAQRQKFAADFAKNLEAVCKEIVNQQRASTLSSISYLEYTILYTNIVNRNYTSEVRVYGEDWHLDEKQQMIGEPDISPLFTYYDELWNELLTQIRRYIGKINVLEVKEIMLKTLPDFYSYLTSIARIVIRESLGKNLFKEIAKTEEFRVSVGEYMNTSRTDFVYIETQTKEIEALNKSFNEKDAYNHRYGDYSGLDFCGNDFTAKDFAYSQFQNTCLNKVSLKNSKLEGTTFNNAQMEDCRLDNSIITEADFTQAALKNATFTRAKGSAGLANNDKWHQAGFIPVSFRYADLTGASFIEADLSGADFTGAILKRAYFIGTDLTNADFTGAILTDTDFTDAILDGAKFDDNIDR